MIPSNVAYGSKVLGAVIAGSVILSGCATEDYVDKHVAAVNARIDQTDAHIGPLDAKANQVAQVAAAANTTAQQAASAAQAAMTQAQAATTDAARANERLDKLHPQVGHLMHHHKHGTWRNVSHKKHEHKSKRKPKNMK